MNVFSKIFIALVCFLVFINTGRSQESFTSENIDFGKDAQIDWDKVKERYLIQHKRRVNGSNRCYHEFISKLKKNEYSPIKLDIFNVYLDSYNSVKSHIPLDFSSVISRGYYTYLEMPDELMSTCGFYLSDARVDILNPYKKNRYGDNISIFHTYSHDVFVIYSNEISDIKVIIELICRLASNSPDIKGVKYNQSRDSFETDFKEILCDNYLLNSIDKNKLISTIPKVDVNNFKYRYFVSAKRSTSIGDELTFLMHIDLFIRYEVE